MAMMVFGVDLHMLPRFSGLAIHSRNLLVAHYYLGSATLAAMSLCWIGMEMTPYVDAMRIGLIVSGAGLLLSIFLFAYNIFRSIKPVAPPHVQPQNN